MIFYIFLIQLIQNTKSLEYYSTNDISIIKTNFKQSNNENNGCLRYNKNDPTKCEICKKGYGLNITSNECNICPPGTYSHGGSSECLYCKDYGYCKSFTDEEERKRRCPFFTYKEGCEKCDFCDIGYHTNSLFTDCLHCSSHCLECEGGGSGKCLQCEYGYGLVKNGSYGCELCKGTRQYSDGHTECLSMNDNNKFLFNSQTQTFRWNSCGENCEICSLGKKGACTKCKEGYELQQTDWSCVSTSQNGNNGNSNGNNQTSCKEKTEVLINGKCIQCYEVTNYCSECHIVEKTTDEIVCDECYAPYVLEKNTCKQCPEYYHYEFNTATNKSECVMNSRGCILQVDNSLCIDCQRGYLLDRDSTCFVSYQCEVINDNTCLLCSSGTSLATEGECGEDYNCKYTSNWECLTCQNKYHLNTNSTCEAYQNCEASYGETCLLANVENGYHVDIIEGSKSFGQPIPCENNAAICLTAHKNNKQESSQQIDLSCKNDYYLMKNGLTCISKEFQNNKTNKCKITNSSDCISCENDYYLFDGKCNKVDLLDCFEQINGYCNEEKSNCTERKEKNPNFGYCLKCDTSNGKQLFQGECLTNEEISDRMGCINEFNGKECLCDEANRFTMDSGKCVQIPSGCEEYGYTDKKCIECKFDEENKGYQSKKECYSCSDNYEIDGNCYRIDNNKKLSENNENNNENCIVYSNTGCLRCDEGYFFEEGNCSPCPTNCTVCGIEQDENEKDYVKCYNCEAGNLLNNNECKPPENLTETCLVLMPTNDACVICKDGYYRKVDSTCQQCDESCVTCFLNKNEEECVQCAANYFKDDVSLKEDKLCHHYDELTNCTNKTVTGCISCENGFYLDNTRCEECNDECILCTSETFCLSCSPDHVFTDQGSGKCVHYKKIPHCASASKKEGEYRCGSCESGYQLTSEGYGYQCEEIPPNYWILVGIPVASGIILIIIIVIIVWTTVAFVKAHKREKEKLKNVCIFDMNHSNIKMNLLQNGISTNREIIDFNEFEEEIPVMKQSRELFCVGNNTKNRIEVQFTVKGETEKFEMETNPNKVSLKPGEACEFEIFVKPLCTTNIEEEIVLTVLNVKEAEENQIPIKIKFKTELTTRLDYDELIQDRKLGEGSFGIVFLGSYRGNKVAIKKMKTLSEDSDQEKQMEEFNKEVDMLDKFRSDYLIHFFGACFIPNKICMVTEFAQYGSIQDYMNKNLSRPPQESMRIKVLLDAAKGIEYLHYNGILHRDIKPDNYLLVSLHQNIKVNAKLTDFGATRNINMLQTNMTFTKGIGTPKYMAPEILKRDHYKKPADIYSFAITMLEIFMWEEPFPKSLYRFAWDIADKVVAGERPQLIQKVNGTMKKLIAQSWCQEPRERLEIEQIVALLETQLIKMKK